MQLFMAELKVIGIDVLYDRPLTVKETPFVRETESTKIEFEDLFSLAETLRNEPATELFPEHKLLLRDEMGRDKSLYLIGSPKNGYDLALRQFGNSFLTFARVEFGQ